MSLPVLSNQPSFDALNERQFGFNYSGNQVFKNRLVILKSSDNSEVYNQIQTSFMLYHTLPASILTNGTQYTAKLSVFDVNDTESGFSAPIVFVCHATPILSINLSDNQIIQSSNLDIELTYTSSDGEELNTWQLTLFDSGQLELLKTDLIYASQQMDYAITGLENNKLYYLKISGITVHSMQINTHLIPFAVSYIQPSAFSIVELSNDPDKGLIKIQSLLKSVDGKSTPDPPIYIDNSEVDLTASGSKVWFDSGFLINGDFTKQYVMRNPIPYQICINVTNGVEIMTVKYMIGKFEDGEKAYFLLEVKNKVLTTRVATEIFDLLQPSQSVYLLIQRVNNLYSIKYSLKGE